MISSENTFMVNENEFDSYLKSVHKRRLISSSLIFVVIVSLMSTITHSNDSSFPIIYFISILFFSALLYGLKLGEKTFEKFKNATYTITKDELILSSTKLGSRSIAFNQIAVIHKHYIGTTIVKGGLLTKLNYYRPKTPATSIDFEDRIFIPSMTTNYEELIGKIKSNSQQ